MKRLDAILAYVPRFLSSRVSVLIGVLLFCYLFVFGGIAALLGHADWVPDGAQLIFGNYTNVLSMVGAGVAAGASHSAAKNMKAARRQHVQTHQLLAQINAKLDSEG